MTNRIVLLIALALFALANAGCGDNKAEASEPQPPPPTCEEPGNEDPRMDMMCPAPTPPILIEYGGPFLMFCKMLGLDEDTAQGCIDYLTNAVAYHEEFDPYCEAYGLDTDGEDYSPRACGFQIGLIVGHVYPQWEHEDIPFSGLPLECLRDPATGRLWSRDVWVPIESGRGW